MEFSDDVLEGLSYLAGSNHVTDENFKQIVNSCLGLLAGEQNIERVSAIRPEKGDIIRKSYAALLAFAIEAIRNEAEEDVKAFLTKQNFKTSRIDYYINCLNANRKEIAKSLKNCSSGWPNIVDTTWRLDYLVKSNIQNQIGEAVYYIVLTTEREGKLDYVKFTCDLHQLQDLSTKLKEIVCHIEKISYI